MDLINLISHSWIWDLLSSLWPNLMPIIGSIPLSHEPQADRQVWGPHPLGIYMVKFDYNMMLAYIDQHLVTT